MDCLSTLALFGWRHAFAWSKWKAPCRSIPPEPCKRHVPACLRSPFPCGRVSIVVLQRDVRNSCSVFVLFCLSSPHRQVFPQQWAQAASPKGPSGHRAGHRRHCWSTSPCAHRIDTLIRVSESWSATPNKRARAWQGVNEPVLEFARARLL